MAVSAVSFLAGLGGLALLVTPSLLAILSLAIFPPMPDAATGKPGNER